MFLISLFQECTKCHTTTTELHQSSFFGQKKPTSPQILLSLNGLQFSTYAEHSNIRTYIMSKIPMRFQSNRFLIFGLWYFLANPLGHCHKFLAADLFTLVYLCPHTGVYFLNQLLPSTVWHLFLIFNARWTWEGEIVPLFTAVLRTLKNRRPWSVSTEFQSQSYCHYQIGILSPVIMWRMKEISPFSREGLPLMAMSFFKAGPGCAKQTTITANLLMHLEGRLFKLWDANLEFFLALNKYVTAQVGMIL